MQAMNATDHTGQLSVLFVCMGNICRSPTAEGLVRHRLQQLGLAGRVHIDSAGTHGYHVGRAPDPRAQQAAARRGIDLAPLRARRVDPEDFLRFDLILAMDSDNREDLERVRPEGARAQLRLMLEYAPDAGVLDVPDPYYGGANGFERVLDLLEHAADGLLDDLRRRLDAPR